MPAEDFLKAIDQLKNIINPNKTMIVLTGGEVLVRKDIESVGINLFSRGFPWGIVTNGMLLDERKLESLLKSGLRAVTVSLDGLEGSHNWLRGNKNSFKNALRAISLLPQSPGLVYDVVTCVNKKNFSELSQVRDLLISTGVKEWRVFTVFPSGRAKENEQLQLDPAEFKGLFDFIRQTRQEGKINVNYGCEGFLGDYEREARDDFFFCRAGINIASVLADGSIAACPSIRDSFVQGNIYKDNFADTWQNKYEVFRDRSWTKKGMCSECEFYKYCEGNGMHLYDHETGELSLCHLKRIREGEMMPPANPGSA
jgi:radical SAM enzyme (rSAM/lipoprotein system)